MVKKLSIMFALVSLLLGGHALAEQSKKTLPVQVKDKEAIRQTLRSFERMFVAEELKIIDEVFHPLAMICWQSENPNTMSREEYREDMRDTFRRRIYRSVKMDDVQIEIAGNLASVSCKETHSMKDNDDIEKCLVRMTLIKTKERWQILTKVTERQQPGLPESIGKGTPAKVSKGLVAHYPFNGNADDLSGIGNHGTLHGVTSVSGRFGRPDTAYYFDGSACITVTNHPSLNITNAITIAAWIKAETSDTPGYVVAKGDFQPYALHVPEWPDYPGGEKDFVAILADNHFNAPCAFDTWMHVAFTYDRQKGIVCQYVGGELVIRQSYAAAFKVNDADLQIGRRLPSNYYFKGIIDDLQIYDRALTSEEVQALYSSVETPMGLERAIMSPAEAIQKAAQQLPELIESSNRTSDKNSLRVIAFIDGVSHLVVQGGEIRWHNEQWAAPGRLEGANFPTIINGESWQPKWPAEGEVRGDVWSAPLKLSEDTGSSFVLNDLSLVRARGSTKISEVKPEGFIVTFDDGLPLGGDWYSVIIHLQSRD